MSKDKKIVWTPRQLRDYEEEVVCRTVTLVLATLMDEYDFDKDDLDDFAKRFCRYSTAIKEHIITMGKVVDIIREETGVNIHW